MELEAKYKCENLSEVKEKAKKLGFALGKKKHQIDTYFIMNEKKADGTRHYLRIREDNMKGTISLDYHIVLSLLETDETEMEIKDKEKMKKMLELLGLNVKCVVDKDREEYKKDKVGIICDNIRGLGTFVEIEINDELSKENENLIKEVAESLGLDEKDRVVKKGYPDLLMEKGVVE